MTTQHITTLRTALETAYINGATASSLAYRPQFVSNNYKEGRKVISSIEDELLSCEQFAISVAFIFRKYSEQAYSVSMTCRGRRIEKRRRYVRPVICRR